MAPALDLGLVVILGVLSPAAPVHAAQVQVKHMSVTEEPEMVRELIHDQSPKQWYEMEPACSGFSSSFANLLAISPPTRAACLRHSGIRCSYARLVRNNTKGVPGYATQCGTDPRPLLLALTP